MSKLVKIAAIQFKTETVKEMAGSREKVMSELAGTLDSLSGSGIDLVVTSECVEDRVQKMEQAERLDRPGRLLQLYQSFAVAEKCHVAGSIKLWNDGKIFNSIVFIDANGQILGHYDKTFLVRGEITTGLQPGNGPVVVDTAIGRMGGIICFDLNFTELMNSYRKLCPEIMVFSSMYHGGLMQAQWAYQLNTFFVSALPRFGCGILDPFGRPVKLTDCYSAVACATVNLDYIKIHLDHNQYKFSDIERKYRDEVVIDIPADIGSALIYSTVPHRTASDIVDEFELIRCKDYFARSIAENNQKRSLVLT